MLGNLGSMMKQLQQAQKRAQEAQEELAQERLEVSAGGGVVKVVANGLGEILEIHLDREQLGLDEDDAGMLEDAILAGVSEAAGRAREKGQDLMQELTGGLNLPPGLEF